MSGFTLIEMSIVLVIIGLIVGGVLVGQDLIRSAAVRAQIAQIEKFNTAKNTFYARYQALPGDMNPASAKQFGFAARAGSEGQGDGNGILEGFGTVGSAFGICGTYGENTMFWSDLTYANGMNLNLIEGSFSKAFTSSGNNICVSNAQGFCSSTPDFVKQNLPEARIGGGNYVYTFSTGYWSVPSGPNYFGLAVVLELEISTNCWVNSNPGLTVKQAYDIDSKVDDGLPQSGRVLAQYINPNIQWAAGGGGTYFASPSGAAPGASAIATSSTCYDNGGNSANSMQYSLSQNNGAGVNCALAFQFQ